jgi:hypothetical protein
MRHGRKKRKRKWLRRLLILAVIVSILVGAMLVAGNILLGRLPEIIARRLEERFPVKAEVGAVTYTWPCQFEVTDVVVRRKSDDSLLLEIRRVRTAARPMELIAGHFRLDELMIEQPTLSLRRSDEALLPKGEVKRPPDFPIEIRGLTVSFDPEWKVPAPRPFRLSGVGIALKPEASRCLSVVGSGASAAMGRFWCEGIIGGQLMDSTIKVSFPQIRVSKDAREALPEEARALWDELQPRGTAALAADVSIPRTVAEGELPFSVNWRLSLRGASMNVPRLSKRLTDVSAVIEGGLDHFLVTDARGRYGSAFVSCKANSIRVGKDLGLRVSGTSRDLNITDELMELLGPKARKAVRRLHIVGGKLNTAIDIRLAPGLKDGRQVLIPDFLHVDLDFRGCKAKPEWCPYPLERVSGSCRVSLDDLVISTPIIGWHGKGSVKVSGNVGFKLAENAPSELIVDARGLAIDEELRTAVAKISPGTKRALEKFGVRDGKLDATAMLKGRLDRAHELDWSVLLGFEGTTAKFDKFPYELSGLTGQIQIGPDRVTFKDLIGRHGDASVRIAGWVDPRLKRDGMALSIRGTAVPLDKDLRAALGPKTQAEWDRLQPRGQADLDVLLSAPTKAGEVCDVRIDAALNNCAARVPLGEKWLKLRRVTGRVESFGNVIRLTGIEAAGLRGTIRADATLLRGKTVQKLKGRFSAEAISVASLARIAPKETEEQIRLLEPTGQLTVRDLRVDAVLRPGKEPDLQYAYTVDLRDVGVSIPMSQVRSAKGGKMDRIALSEINGRLRVRNARGRVATGTFEFDKVRLLYGTMREVVGKVEKVGPMFALKDVRGRMYGGEVEAEFKGATDLQFFNGYARVTEMDVTKLARETKMTGQRVWGNLNGAVHLNGERIVKKGKPVAWRLGGSGHVRIDRANLGTTPLVRSIISYKSFLLGKKPTIEGAEANFQINAKELTVDKLVLTGPTVSTKAVGKIMLEDEAKIDLYFYRKRKGSLLPDIILIEWLGRGLNWAIDQFQNNLVVIRVAGPLGKPKVTAVPAKDLIEKFGNFVLLNLWEEQRESKARPADATGK